MSRKATNTTNTETLRVVCRNSPLSLVQVEEIFSRYPSLRYELHSLDSFGDKNNRISLLHDKVPGDFFTRELDALLLDGKADVSIHSAKDLPYPLPAGLELYCLTRAEDKTDALVSRGGLRLDELPKGARVGTSSARRRADLLRLRPDLSVVSIRGKIEERIAQVDCGYVDALIVAACALKRLGLEGRAAEILPFATHPLQGNLAVVGVENNRRIRDIFASSDVRASYGRVTLVGFGPGDPSLLTIAGDKALREADIVFHDFLHYPDALQEYAAEKVNVGKRRGNHGYPQDRINEMLYRAAISGKKVVRLKAGDPMIFARGGEETDYLRSRFVDVAIIPGISAAIALASLGGIPLTHRGTASSVAFVTGHASEEVQTPDADTLVYYMSGANLSSVAARLIAAGRSPDTPVALAYGVSLPDQRIFFTTLGELRFSVVKYPTPILVMTGAVVARESRREHKQNVLLTGTARGDYDGKGVAVHTPLIKIQGNADECLKSLIETSSDADESPPSAARRKICSQDWIVFTSRYGVHYFFEAMRAAKCDLRALSSVKIASVGKTTSAELAKHGFYPDAEASPESAEGLLAQFRAMDVRNRRILLPRSDKGLKQLSEELEKLGNRVTDIPVYSNTFNERAEKVDISRFAKIVFASPSAVDSFLRLYGELPQGIQLAAKGETTRNKIKQELYETF